MDEKKSNILIVSNIRDKCPSSLKNLCVELFLKGYFVFQLNIYDEILPKEETVRCTDIENFLLQVDIRESHIEEIRRKIHCDFVLFFPNEQIFPLLLQFYSALKHIYAEAYFVGVYSEEMLFFEKAAFLSLDEKLKIAHVAVSFEKIIDKAIITVESPYLSLTNDLKRRECF